MNKELYDLIEKLVYYYEIDLDNCTMKNGDWIEELAKAMLDENYKKKFLEQYEDYKALRDE